MYLEHFGFKEFPFTLTPNLHFYCNLHSYQGALNVITISLKNGEGFVKITGEAGTGKTLLCRKLLNSLNSEYVTAYISNPNLDYFSLLKAIARELEISFPDNIDHHQLLHFLTEKLIAFRQAGKKTIVIIDEAQVLTDEVLEGLRLLTNLETESSKLIQLVLFGQPELDRRLDQPHLRQLKQRIAFSYCLPQLHHNEVISYLCYRLNMAGYLNTYDNLFTRQACKLLIKASKGIPRLVNILCHKALLIAYGYNKSKVDSKAMRLAIYDTESVAPNSTYRKLYYYLVNGSALVISTSIIAYGIYFILRSLNL
jgi:MSHA biogenesis protein MshM